MGARVETPVPTFYTRLSVGGEDGRGGRAGRNILNAHGCENSRRSPRNGFATGSGGSWLIQPRPRAATIASAFNDLLVMRLTKELLTARRHLEPMQRCLARVRELVDPARSVTSLKLVNDEGRIVVSEGGIMIEAETGQLLLDFRLERPTGKIEEGFGPARVRERFEEARRIAEKGSGGADDLQRVGAVASPATSKLTCAWQPCSSARAICRARCAICLERRRSCRPAPRFICAWASSIARKKKPEHALRSFLRAVDCDPTNVEAHRNVAELFESQGRKRDAQKHLSAIHRLIKGD